MGDRIYTASFENVTVAAVQDLFYLKAGSANGFELVSISLTAGGSAPSGTMRVRLKRLPATVTVGSGGSAPTISAIDSGDTKTATATARANDTTQATTSGTAAILANWQWNVMGEFLPQINPDTREKVQPGEALVLDLAAAPTSTPVSGTIRWLERT